MTMFSSRKKKHNHKGYKPSTNQQSYSHILQNLKLLSLFRVYIFIVLCVQGHVLAIRRGRLMSPSSFIALSGDLHVQIQFNGEDEDRQPKSNYTTSRDSTTEATTISSRTNTNIPFNLNSTNTVNNGIKSNGEKYGQSAMESTLVISKFLDDFTAEQSRNQQINTTVQPRSYNESNIVERPLQRKRKEVIKNIPLYPDPRLNITQIAIPCQVFLKGGGTYEMKVVTNRLTQLTNFPANATTPQPEQSNPVVKKKPISTVEEGDERLNQILDVRWPGADMQVHPLELLTYPEKPVEVILRFPEVNCNVELQSGDLPEFWLELVYCGKERSCSQMPVQNISKSNMLYAEQIRGFPKYKVTYFRCELFGLAGNYAVQLRPMQALANIPITRRTLKVDWSDKFVFNVYARSIFPCDPHTGIGVLYEYPNCILDQGDRVRIYSKLRADVASLKPPTSLHYVAEQRVIKSQHSLYFNCDLFTEKFVEYCFVYVSKSISGAVADVRMDCVPTLPVGDSDTGGWGPWSEWTACSTNCLGGTRNRYRFCDSPPPRYGAKFCEGPSVQTEKCGESILSDWDCIYDNIDKNDKTPNRTTVAQEIGPGCRCGCIVHLGAWKPKRIIAGSTQSCPGRLFWLIQVDEGQNIDLLFKFVQLPCPKQYIKVRDGPSLSSNLLIELTGGSKINRSPKIVSSVAQLLVEFYGGEQEVNTEAVTLTCIGGFLANAQQLRMNESVIPDSAVSSYAIKNRILMQKSKLRSKFTLIHLSAVIFASITIFISASLGVQYVVRYKKYYKETRRREEGSRLHTPHTSMGSLARPPSRALSTTTLLSEVIFLVKMRPKRCLRHSILRESVDAENAMYETNFSRSDVNEQTKCNEEEVGSHGSLLTLRNEQATIDDDDHCKSDEIDPNHLGDDDIEKSNTLSNSGTLTEYGKEHVKDSESMISSGMSSVYNSPIFNSQRISKYSDRFDNPTLRIKSPAVENDNTSLQITTCPIGTRSVSASLTNRSCYSPSMSILSAATGSSTNPKESKDKQNRRKLLARPTSEFSLGNHEELEMDYYDYNVTNAGAAPGSYLGMDPAYLLWIPPFENAADICEDATTEEHTPEMLETAENLFNDVKMTKYGHFLSTHSNSESLTNTTTNTSPTSEEVSPLCSSQQSKASTPGEATMKFNRISRSGLTQSKDGDTFKQPTPYMTRKKRRAFKQQSKSVQSLAKHKEQMPLFTEVRSIRSVKDITISSTKGPELTLNVPMESSTTSSYVEKETRVVKSPSDLQKFLALDDIQYADECEGETHIELDFSTVAQEANLHKRKPQTKLVGNDCTTAVS